MTRYVSNPRGRWTKRLAVILIPAAVLAIGWPMSTLAQQSKAKPDFTSSAQTTFINQELAKVWEAEKITPSEIASDYEFIRRAFLDIIGRIAKPEEIAEFMKDPPATRRRELIKRLLHSERYAEDYATHWANIWTTWTLSRSVNSIYREQTHLWFETKFMKNTPYKDIVTELITATGPNNENGAVNFIMLNLGETLPKPEDGRFEAVPITSRVTRLFLGLQTQCVQCHDHPFNKEWTQKHFWGVNAFFRQTVRDKTPTGPNMNPAKGMDATVVRLSDDPSLNPSGIVFYEKRSGEFKGLKATFLDGRKMPTEAGSNRRRALAQMVVTHENFNKAFVNRMWAHFFGHSLNEQAVADDFGEHNAIVHPELLERLGKDFAEYARYDIKELIYWICTSDAYGLSAKANPTNNKQEHEKYFSRMIMKAMSPEVLFESLTTANRSDLKGPERKELRRQWLNKLVRNFGDDEGNEVTFNGTVVQALLMMNGRELHNELTRKDEKSTVNAAIKKYAGKPAQIINELFLSALNRPATEKEVKTLISIYEGRATVPASAPTPKDKVVSNPKVKNKVQPKQPPATTMTADRDPVLFYQDVFWALINSNEFILNH
jgi:hypothetical protein